MVFKRRTLFGFLVLLVMYTIILCVRLVVEQPSPTVQNYIFGNATLSFETDRTRVWQIGDCVNLRWNTENIQAIYLNRLPTVGQREIQWCVNQQSYPPFFTINLPDGTVQYLSPFEISTVRTRIILTLVPLLLVAAWCFRLHLLLASLFRRLPKRFLAPFMVAEKVQPVLVVLFIGINAIVAWNSITIRPWMGYDVEGHYANTIALAQGHLPTEKESAEFFSPPLSYLFPALFSKITGLTDAPVQKFGQLQNILVSLIATFIMLRISAKLYPDKVTPRALALFLLGMLTVYYKTFAFMRGEPFVVMFALLLCDQLLTMTQRKPALWDALLIGFYGGMMVLSRQWGALVLAGAGVWWLLLLLRQKNLALRLLYPGLAGGIIAVILGGWFYLALAAQTGSILAFNRQTDAEAKPASFFTGLGGEKLFTYPFSPGYDGQAVPIFYTETWGDYFGYFYLQRPPIPSRIPADSLSYLGIVNAVSVIPTIILLAGFIFATRGTLSLILTGGSGTSPIFNLMNVIVIVSLIGFVWFLARYPSHDADTAKATYLLHIFPLLCLAAGDWLTRIEQKYPRLFRVLLISLIAVAVYNFPMLFTRIN